jgi:ribonuclease BN (tRNA processing enzyme)
VRGHDLECRLTLHDDPLEPFEIPEFLVHAALVTHPGPTVGYRLEHADGVLTYLSDHEPALGVIDFPEAAEWTSGYDLAYRADVLVHDAQYTAEEYAERPGWGHSSIPQALAFATLAEVRHLIAFHHDPAHDDAVLDALFAEVPGESRPFDVTVAHEGLVIDLHGHEMATVS